jgi:lysophospholipase L1-like esterase
MGDSTGVGVGAKDPSHSVPGRFASFFPKANIENVSISGARLADLDNSFKVTKKYDFIVIMIGANDIVHLTSTATAREHLLSIVKKAKQSSLKVVILHGGNVGSSPIFPLPLRWLYSHRTKKFQKLYTQVANSEKIIYVDMYTNLQEFPHYQNGVSTYAKDSFHPSDEGYKIWFDLIVKSIDAHSTV